MIRIGEYPEILKILIQTIVGKGERSRQNSLPSKHHNRIIGHGNSNASGLVLPCMPSFFTRCAASMIVSRV